MEPITVNRLGLERHPTLKQVDSYGFEQSGFSHFSYWHIRAYKIIELEKVYRLRKKERSCFQKSLSDDKFSFIFVS